MEGHHLLTLKPSSQTLQKISCILLILLIVLSPVSFGFITAGSVAAAGTDSIGTTATSVPTPSAATGTVLVDPATSAELDINGKAYVLYEAESNTFLLGKNADQPLSPASITKVMTILLAFEKLELKDTITVTREMFETIPNDYMRLGLVEGETITVEDAIHGALLLSANDTTMALALKMSPTVADFSELMNTRAKELGCTATTFTNPYGLAEPSNLTTAHDMALIMAEALKHEDFIRISRTKTYLLPATDKTGARGMTNGNRFIKDAKYAAYTPHLSSKTGFTNLSGNTIVSGARQDGRTLVGVILGATSSIPRYDNLITLFSLGFDDFHTQPVDKTSYTAASDEFVAEIKAEIKAKDLKLEIAATSVKLVPFITSTKSRMALSSSAVVGTPEGNLTALANIQGGRQLEYPLYAEFSDQTRILAGRLSITFRELAAIGSSGSASGAGSVGSIGGSNSAANPNSVNAGTLILRILLIALAGLALAALIVYILMRREIKRRRRQRMLASRSGNYGVRKVRLK